MLRRITPVLALIVFPLAAACASEPPSPTPEHQSNRNRSDGGSLNPNALSNPNRSANPHPGPNPNGGNQTRQLEDGRLRRPRRLGNRAGQRNMDIES